MRRKSRPGKLLPAVVVLVVGAAIGVMAQEQPAPATRIESDGALRSVTDAAGRRTTILRDNVRLYRDDMRARSDSALFYDWRKEYRLFGNVEVQTDSMQLTTQELLLRELDESGTAYGDVRIETVDGVIASGTRAHYRRADNWLAIVGNARVIDGDLVVSGDSLSIERAHGILRAFGAVRVVDEVNDAVVTGERGVFDRRSGVAVVDSLPHLVSRRQAGEVTEVDSRWMSFDRRVGSSTAIGDVRFRQGMTAAFADSATFVGESTVFLRGAPRVEQGARTITGEQIRIHYQMRRLHQMDVYGDAELLDATPDTLKAEFSGIPTVNKLAGDTLRVYLDQGAVSRTTVNGNARSVYLPEDQKKTISVNEVSGQSIDISFRDATVDQVDVMGGVEGRYRFLDRSTIAEMDSAAADSAIVVGAAGDSLATAIPDSLKLVDFATSSDEVKYRGDRTLFKVAQGRILISGNAEVEHGTLRLTAGNVNFDTTERELMAEDAPHLVDRESELVGERMGYLFDPQTGAVADGATRFDNGYYTGKHIRRVDKETLLVREGTFSTCDLAAPHYHFSARKMKLKVGEKVVARQVTLLVSDIPLVMLPFYYKSLDSSGRHSGILFPGVNLGVSSREGRYIRDFGYYWATNEYTDFKLLADWNERRDLALTLENQYNVRYGMRGSVRMDWLRRFSETEAGDEWAFVANHRQPELFEVWDASASLNYRSSNVTRSDLGSNSTSQLLPTEIRSTGALNRRFDNGSSLSLSMSRLQRVNNEDDNPATDNQLVQQTLPSLRLTFRTLPLMDPLRPGQSGNPFLRPLRDTTFSQSYGSEWQQNRKEASQRDDIQVTSTHGLNYAPSSIGPLKWSSGLNFSDNFVWTHTKQDYVDFPDSIAADIPASESRESDNSIRLSLRNSVGTDIYGFLLTPMGPIRAFKHKVSFSAAHTLTPAIRDQQLRSESYSFGMKNEFSVKVRDNDAQPDESGEIPTRKIDQLVTWDVNASLNPQAPADRQWGAIGSRVTIRSPLAAVRDVSIDQSIDPYSFNVLRTQISTNLSLRGSLDLGGEMRKSSDVKNSVLEQIAAPVDSAAVADSLAAAQTEATEDPYQAEFRRDAELFSQSDNRNVIAWTFAAGIGFWRDTDIDGAARTRASFSPNATVKLPGDWAVSWSSNVDAANGEFKNQRISLIHSLHCWKLAFSRAVDGDGSDFNFRLYLDEIPELEVKRGNDQSSLGLERLRQF